MVTVHVGVLKPSAVIAAEGPVAGLPSELSGGGLDGVDSGGGTWLAAGRAETRAGTSSC
jgi:hypothetical protein